MGEILTFTPRPKQAAPELPGPVYPTDLRAEIEASAQAALDMADRFIAILDRLEEDPDHEGNGDAELSLAAPENQGSQVTWLRGTDQDRAAEAPETSLPEVAAKTTVVQVSPPRWGGNGNILAAAGAALLDLLERA